MPEAKITELVAGNKEDRQLTKAWELWFRYLPIIFAWPYLLCAFNFAFTPTHLIYSFLTFQYARHAQLVTETVLEHLIKEIHNKYPDTTGKNRNSSIPKMMRRLKMKLKNHIKKNRHSGHKKKSHQMTTEPSTTNQV